MEAGKLTIDHEGAGSGSESGRTGPPTPGQEKKSEGGGDNVAVPVKFIIVASVVSSVSLIIVNKAIMKNYNFHFVLCLTAFHFLCTSAAMKLLALNKVFEPQSMPTVEAVKMAAAGVGSIVFMNLSLSYNSVGTYQMMKLAVIPCAMVLSYLAKGTTYSTKRMASLAVLLFGVAIATVNDVELRFSGLMFGIVAVLTTALFQTWQGTKQKEFNMSPMQLLLAVAPYQALITGVLAVGIESDVVNHTFQDAEVLLICVSGSVAVSVNLCSMGLIGKTSAVVYQVVGHAKTCLILLGGYLLFTNNIPGDQQVKNLIGVAIAMSGVFWYTHLRLTNQ